MCALRCYFALLPMLDCIDSWTHHPLLRTRSLFFLKNRLHLPGEWLCSCWISSSLRWILRLRPSTHSWCEWKRSAGTRLFEESDKNDTRLKMPKTAATEMNISELQRTPVSSAWLHNGCRIAILCRCLLPLTQRKQAKWAWVETSKQNPLPQIFCYNQPSSTSSFWKLLTQTNSHLEALPNDSNLLVPCRTYIHQWITMTNSSEK